MRKKSLIILPVLLFVTLFCALSLGFTKKGNDLEISYEIPKTESYVGERVNLPEIFTVHPDRVRDIVITVKSPAGEEIAVEENSFRRPRRANTKCISWQSGVTEIRIRNSIR